MNDILTSIIDYIDSHLSYKFKRGQRDGLVAMWQGSGYLSTTPPILASLRKDFRVAYTSNAIESVELCGQLFCFILNGNDIIVHSGQPRSISTMELRPLVPMEIIECYKFNVCDNAENGIDTITAMLMLQELKHLPHDKEDLVLDRLLDCICLADRRFKRDNDLIKTELSEIMLIIKPKMVYPRLKGIGRCNESSRLLCIEYYQENSNNRFSVSYNFNDVRCFKKIVKWLAKDRFNNCISSHTL